MPRYVALLRALNVGGHIVKMDALRGHFEEMGFSQVESVIASGNVIFSTTARNPEAIEARIEKTLASALGYEVATFLRRREELEAVVAFDPYPLMAPAAADHVLSVAFLKSSPQPDATAALLAMRNDIDDFVVRGREVFCLRRTKQGDSALTGSRFERTLRLAATARNITTVRKLALRG